MTSGEANLVVRWIAQELARVGPTTPTHFSVVAKGEITVYQQLSLCWVKP
jgi:hypothetical protein